MKTAESTPCSPDIEEDGGINTMVLELHNNALLKHCSFPYMSSYACHRVGLSCSISQRNKPGECSELIRELSIHLCVPFICVA